jgi:hypothetical protein
VFIIVILFPYILLGTLASKAVQGSRFKIVCISVVAFAVNLVVWPYALSWRGVPIYIALMAAITAGLIYWCGIARRRALKIVGWYLAANSILVVLAAALFAVG